MNPLKILLIISLVIYFIFYERGFLYYYIPVVISYAVITELIYGKFKIKSSKLTLFMTMWSAPYDPQIYARIKLSINKSIKRLEELSLKHKTEITFTALVAKITGNLLKKYPLANTSIVFGKIIPRKTCDVTLLLSFGDATQNEMITIKDCDKKSVVDIQIELNRLRKELNDGKNKEHNMRFNFTNYCPSL